MSAPVTAIFSWTILPPNAENGQQQLYLALPWIADDEAVGGRPDQDFDNRDPATRPALGQVTVAADGQGTNQDPDNAFYRRNPFLDVDGGGGGCGPLSSGLARCPMSSKWIWVELR